MSFFRMKFTNITLFRVWHTLQKFFKFRDTCMKKIDKFYNYIIGRRKLKTKRGLIIIGLVIIFVFIQLIPVDRENPSSNPKSEIRAQQEIMAILKNSCYDCHSNKTNWPIYSYIAPVSWLVSSDVEKGRRNLNFSEWTNLSPEKKNIMREEIAEEVIKDKMPLSIYLIMHSGAKLSEKEKKIIKKWADLTVD